MQTISYTPVALKTGSKLTDVNAGLGEYHKVPWKTLGSQ